MKLLYSLLLIIVFLFFTGCGQVNKQIQAPKPKSNSIRIAISKAKGSKGYLKYGIWLQKLDSNIVYFDLYHISKDSALIIIKSCDGLLLSGGPDVSPNLYNQAYDTVLCETIDTYRDSLEYSLIEQALAMKMPILGICRGEQIINVYMGGSLYPDIPTAKPNNVGHRFAQIDSSMHTISVANNSLLANITESIDGIVNSSHHQAVDRLANNLIVLARTQDSIVESISWKEPKEKSFLLGVQWHPEWLKTENPFSGKIGHRFIKEARIYQSTK